MALLTVYDAIVIDTIPGDAEYFLGYESTIALLQARFPHAKKIWRITTDADPTAFLDYDGIDCENGDATPEIAAVWAYNKIAAKLGRPWIYVEIANRLRVVTALGSLGLTFGPAPAGQVDCWLAWWFFDPTPPTFIPHGMYQGWDTGIGNVAWQYYNQSKFTYDVSVASYAWAYPPPPPSPEEAMFDAIQIVPTPKYPNAKGSIFLNAGTAWIGPLDELSVIELNDNKATIFKSKTNSIFNGKPVIPYPTSA